MNHINMNERMKFQGPIKEVLGILNNVNDSLYVRGEYFGYFVNRMSKRYLADANYVQNSFNSTFFNTEKKGTLSNAADSIAAIINRSDPINAAGELCYALAAVYQGFLGFAEGFDEASYGLRVYLRGIVEKVLQSIETINSGSQKDMSMAFRRHLVVRGVLADVVSIVEESMKTSEKISIWDKNGKLLGQGA